MVKQVHGGPAWVPAVCTKGDLASLFGVSLRTMSDLDQRGILVKGAGRGQYLAMPSIDAYVSLLRKTAAGRTEETMSKLNERRLANESVSLQISEYKLAELKGEMLSVEEIIENWTAFATKVKAAFLGVPTKIRARLPHLSLSDGEAIKKIVRDILVSLSKDVEADVISGDPDTLKPNSSDSISRKGKRK